MNSRKFFKSITDGVRSRERLGSLLSWLAILTPPLLLIILLIKYSVNVPFWDSWELVPLFEKINNGTVQFSDYFAQHNEHRLLFPRLIMAGLAVFSQWNAFYEIATSVILALIAYGFLISLVYRFLQQKTHRIAAIVLIGFVFFSPIQFENWMWGWQIQWYLNVLALVIAVWALAAIRIKPWVSILIAILVASVATYSLASGFFVWLVAIPLLWFNKDFRKFLPVWLGSAILVIASHYIGYVDPSYHPSKTLFLTNPIGLIEYLLVYIARPLVPDFLLSIPIALGYFLLLVAIARLWYTKSNIKSFTEYLPWVSLGLYALFAALSTSLSRLGLGIEQAYSNRYTTLSSLLLIMVIVFLFKGLESLKDRRNSGLYTKKTFYLSAILVLVLLVVTNVGKGVIQMQERNAYLVTVKDCALSAASPQDPCLVKLYPSAEIVWPRLEYVRSINWIETKDSRP